VRGGVKEGGGGVKSQRRGLRGRKRWGDEEREMYLIDKPRQHPGSDDSSMSYPTH